MNTPKPNRREFLQQTAAVSAGLALAPAVLAGTPVASAATGTTQPPAPIWRNKRAGMSYRMLGRTGMMVSELVIGTFRFNDPTHFPILDDEIERGMNYIDCAAAYSQGKVESNMGVYIKDRGIRDDVFLATKLSSYYGYLGGVMKEIEKNLSSSQIEALKQKAAEMIEERGVLKPGYHHNYFGGQEGQVPSTYYRYLVLKEHGYREGWKQKVKDHARKLLHGSLERLQTDHLDVLHCPHGIAMPEMMDDEPLQEVFAEFKQEGLIRAAAVSFHNDVGAHLSKAIDAGYYDVAMFAYNIANQAALEPDMHRAHQAGLGMIAMKVARLFAMQNQPAWRQQKLDTAIPDPNTSTFAKAYLWALQNPNLSACVSQMESLDEVADNYAIVGRKVDLQPV